MREPLVELVHAQIRLVAVNGAQRLRLFGVLLTQARRQFKARQKVLQPFGKGFIFAAVADKGEIFEITLLRHGSRLKIADRGAVGKEKKGARSVKSGALPQCRAADSSGSTTGRKNDYG